MKKDIILHVKDVSLSFYLQKDSLNVLNDISLEVEKGKVTAIIGSNGSGKTTLFNLINGFIKLNKGEIIFISRKNYTRIVRVYSLTKMPPHKISSIGIGRLFQDIHIFPNMSVKDNLLIGDNSPIGTNLLDIWLKPKNVEKEEKKRKDKAVDVIEMVMGSNADIFMNKLNDYANTLSYGQQKILAILRLLMGDYKLLLLDEPTSGVNIETVGKIQEIVSDMVKKYGKTVILVEHNMSVVKEIADWVIFIDEGRVFKEGTPTDVLEDEEVRRRYLGR